HSIDRGDEGASRDRDEPHQDRKLEGDGGIWRERLPDDPCRSEGEAGRDREKRLARAPPSSGLHRVIVRVKAEDLFRLRGAFRAMTMTGAAMSGMIMPIVMVVARRAAMFRGGATTLTWDGVVAICGRCAETRCTVAEAPHLALDGA